MKKHTTPIEAHRNMIRKVIRKHVSQTSSMRNLDEKLVTLFTRDDKTGKSIRKDLDLDDDVYEKLTSEKEYTEDARLAQMSIALGGGEVDDETVKKATEQVENSNIFKFTKRFTAKQYPKLTDVERFKIFKAVSQCQKKTTEGYDVLVSHAAETILKGGPVYKDWSERNFKRDFWNFYKNAMDWEMPSKSGGQIGRGEPQLEMAYMCSPQKPGDSDFKPLGESKGYAIKYFPDEGSTVKTTHVDGSALKKTLREIFKLTHGKDVGVMTLGTRTFASEGIGDWASKLKNISQDPSHESSKLAKELMKDYKEQMEKALKGFVTDGGHAHGLIAFSSEDAPVLHKNWLDFRMNSFNMKDPGLTKYCRVDTTGYNFPLNIEDSPAYSSAAMSSGSVSKSKASSKIPKRVPATIVSEMKLLKNFVLETLNK